MSAHDYCPGHPGGSQPTGDATDLRKIECEICQRENANELADFLDSYALLLDSDEAEKVRGWAHDVRTTVGNGKLYYIATYCRDRDNYDYTEPNLYSGVFTSREAAKAYVYEDYEKWLKRGVYSSAPKRPVFFEDRQPSPGQSRAWPQEGDYTIEEIDMINGEQV